MLSARIQRAEKEVVSSSIASTAFVKAGKKSSLATAVLRAVQRTLCQSATVHGYIRIPNRSLTMVPEGFDTKASSLSVQKCTVLFPVRLSFSKIRSMQVSGITSSPTFGNALLHRPPETAKVGLQRFGRADLPMPCRLPKRRRRNRMIEKMKLHRLLRQKMVEKNESQLIHAAARSISAHCAETLPFPRV